MGHLAKAQVTKQTQMVSEESFRGNVLKHRGKRGEIQT